MQKSNLLDPSDTVRPIGHTDSRDTLLWEIGNVPKVFTTKKGDFLHLTRQGHQLLTSLGAQE